MTPVELEILIHCHTRQEPPPRLDSQATKDAIEIFLTNNIIKSTDKPSVYTTTNKGSAWLLLILNTPVPTQAWVDKNGNVIKGLANDKTDSNPD